MDRMPRSNEGYGNLFPDSQPYHTYDNSFLNATDSAFNDPSWAVNPGNYPVNSSRAQPPASSWQQSNANHLSTSSAQGNLNVQAPNYSRSLSHSPAPFAQDPYGGYVNQQQNFQQYRQPQYDPALFNHAAPGQEFNSNYATYGRQPQNPGTIAPQALEQETRPPTTGGNNADAYAPNTFDPSRYTKLPAVNNVDQLRLTTTIPKGTDNGYLSVINFDQMAHATNSVRMANYLNIGRETQEWPINRTTSLPQYVPRRSKNDLRKLAGSDAALLSKIGRRSVKKERPLATGSSLPQTFGTIKGPGSPQIKYDGDTSESEESSSDDDDSSYTSDEDLEGSPLPDKRPDHPKDAVEYDTIKALWRPKRKAVDGADMKKGIVSFWEVVKTIRDRWKIDAAAVAEAEVKKRIGELPLLQSRVKDQRDMMESAFKAALKHGHRSIVEVLAENMSLLFVCYQFLLDRFKADDLNCPLSRIILELMALFTTLNDASLEKTHLEKVLPRFVKKGDAKTQFWAKRILSNAAAASKGQPAGLPADKASTSVTAASPTSKRAEPELVAGVKRPASTSGEGGAVKKVATSMTRPNGVPAVMRPTTMTKKPAAPPSDGAKPAASTAAASATKTKQVTAKPSSFFSSLQSAQKKPGTSIKPGTPAVVVGTKAAVKRTTPFAPAAPSTAAKPTFSFAETMANLAKPKEEKPAAKPEQQLPPETPEEKAKRLRKEARRKLHVSFKLGDELVEIRYFSHDPEEELGHDSSQIRDVADAGGEGRALKQHQVGMEIDEEEEVEEVEQKLIEWRVPTGIDFSVVDPEERKRNFAKFGGGENVAVSEERGTREQYEKENLIVFYPDVRDVPPNPREPGDPFTGDTTASVRYFAKPEQALAERARAAKAALSQARYMLHPQQQHPQQQQQYQAMTRGTNQPQIDFSQFFPPQQHQQQQQQQQHQPPQQQQQQQAQASAVDITNILASLQHANLAPAQPPPQQQQQQPAAQLDLSAILANLQQHHLPPSSASASAPQAGNSNFFVGAARFSPTLSLPPQQQANNNGDDGDFGDAEEWSARKRWRDLGGVENAQQPNNYKTKVCRYWQEGRCIKGEGCTYLHREAGGEE